MNKYSESLEVLGKVIVNTPVVDGQLLPAKGFYPCEYKALQEAISKALKYDELTEKFDDIFDVISAMEIIVKKWIYIDYIRRCHSAKEYNDMLLSGGRIMKGLVKCYSITNEEFNLLYDVVTNFFMMISLEAGKK